MTATLVPVTAVYLDAEGAPDTGTVTFAPHLAAVNLDPKRTVTQAPISAALDAAGSLAVDLVASDDPDWAADGPVPYLVTERLAGLRRTWTAVIPGPGPVDLADLQPAQGINVALVPVPGPTAVSADAPNTAILGSDGLILVPPAQTGGATDHQQLTGRDTADGHPIGAVTGLQDALDAKLDTAGGTIRGTLKFWRDGGVLAAGQIAIVPDPGTPGGDALEMLSDDGILIRGPYLVLDTTNLVIVQPGGEVGSPLVIAGFDALGGALMGWGAPIVPAYQVVDSTEASVTIKAAGGTVIPSPWVPLGLEVVCAEAIAAGTGTLAFSMLLLNPTGRSGSVEYGLQVNGAQPFARDVRQDVPANFNATVALSIINARDIAAGDTLTLVARCVEQSNSQFAVSMQASAAEPARLRVARS